MNRIEEIAFDRINRYIERNACDLAEALWDEEVVIIRAFHRAEDDEWEVTEFEPSEEGEWELVNEVDEDYIAEDDGVAEYLREWREDAEAYTRNPYAYNGVSIADFGI